MAFVTIHRVISLGSADITSRVLYNSQANITASTVIIRPAISVPLTHFVLTIATNCFLYKLWHAARKLYAWHSDCGTMSLLKLFPFNPFLAWNISPFRIELEMKFEYRHESILHFIVLRSNIKSNIVRKWKRSGEKWWCFFFEVGHWEWTTNDSRGETAHQSGS